MRSFPVGAVIGRPPEATGPSVAPAICRPVPACRDGTLLSTDPLTLCRGGHWPPGLRSKQSFASANDPARSDEANASDLPAANCVCSERRAANDRPYGRSRAANDRPYGKDAGGSRLWCKSRNLQRMRGRLISAPTAHRAGNHVDNHVDNVGKPCGKPNFYAERGTVLEIFLQDISEPSRFSLRFFAFRTIHS